MENKNGAPNQLDAPSCLDHRALANRTLRCGELCSDRRRTRSAIDLTIFD
jgi:hypothetical protein